MKFWDVVFMSLRDERPHHVGGKALEVEEYAGYVG